MNKFLRNVMALRDREHEERMQATKPAEVPNSKSGRPKGSVNVRAEERAARIAENLVRAKQAVQRGDGRAVASLRRFLQAEQLTELNRWAAQQGLRMPTLGGRP